MALTLQDLSEVTVGLGVVGLEPDRLAKRVGGLGKVPLGGRA